MSRGAREQGSKGAKGQGSSGTRSRSPTTHNPQPIPHNPQPKILHPESLKTMLFLAAATLLFFWPVWVAGYRFPIGGGDLWGQLHPVWSYVAAWIRRGVFPLWSTRMMIGDPIVAEGQYGLFNPINWPLFLFSPIPGCMVSLRGMFSFWLAGAGLYLYLHHSPVWKLHKVAALTGALAYMFADPFISHLGHPQFNDAMAWLPWALWSVDYAARRSHYIPWAGLMLSLIMLSGHGQASLYAALVVGAYALWQSFEGGVHNGPRRIGRLALVGLLGAALAAPSILPGMERLPYTERVLVPFDLRRGYEFRPEMLLDLISPLYHGRGTSGFWPKWDRVENAYVGAVALYLAGWGLLANLRQRRMWFLVGLGTIAYFFALGYQALIYPTLARLPLFAESWKTSRMIFVLSFALAVGAGLGVNTLKAITDRRLQLAFVKIQSIIFWLWYALLIDGGIALWFVAPTWAATVPRAYQSTAQEGLRVAALLAIATSVCGLGLTAKARVVRRVTHYILPLLLLAELTVLGALVETEAAPAQTADPHAAAIDYLRADTGWFRVDVDAAARGLWSPSALQAAGFESPQGSGNPMELAAFSQLYWAVPTKGAPAYQLFSAKYIVVPKGALPGGDGIWPVFLDDPLVDIHLNTNAMNRVWLIYDTTPVTRIEEAYDIIFSKDFAPAQVATVENGPDLNNGGSGTLEVLAYGPNRVSFGVHTSETALLVLSDIVYPGWKGYVDGESVPIYKTNGIFRGIVVPPGDHRVDMRFRPTSLRIGLGLALMAGIGLIVGIWMKTRAVPSYQHNRR